MKRVVGRSFLKALAKGSLSTPPSSKQIEHEREAWGPNPIPGHTEAEDILYLHGERFLMELYAAAVGLNPKGVTFKKAIGDGPFKPPAGWGDIAKVYSAGGDPQKMVSAWEGVLDKLLPKLIPPTSTAQVAGAFAVRTVLLGKLGEKAGVGGWPTFESLLPTLERKEQEVLKWTFTRAAKHVTDITDGARVSLREELTFAAMEHLPQKKLQQRLFDKFSVQNRNWRRVVLTETAFSVQNARLASVDPKDGWEAVWTAGPKACPFCQKQAGKRFKLVEPGAAKNDQTDIWVGKNNVGRSSSPRDRDGNKRTADQLWHPCLPAHPHCVCQWTLVRTKKFAPSKKELVTT
jgi:hypothetical protein